MALNDSLIAWWMLNEESGTRYDTYGSNNLTDNNTVLYGTGKVNNAADFETDNDESLGISDNADLSFGNEDFSLACWINVESIPDSAGLMTKYNSVTTKYEYALYLDGSNKPTMWVADSDALDNTGFVAWGSALDTGTWYHVVGYHDSVNDLVGVVVNAGTPVTSAYSSGCHDGDADFYLGDLPAAADYWFDGLMDEAGVWGKVLSSADRDELYNSGDGMTYAYKDTPTAASCIAASVAPTLRERILGVVASAIAVTVAPMVRERITNVVASAIASTTAPLVQIWMSLFARFHDYFLTAPQKFAISSSAADMTARYRDYNFTAPKRERYG